MASDTGPQSPASGEGETRPPTVEAEIVDAEFVDAPDAIKTGGPEPGSAPPKRALSPGLLFFAGFILVAAVVFGAFTLTRQTPKKPPSEIQQAEESQPAPAAAEEGAAPETEPERPAADLSKIANTGLDTAKEAAAQGASALPPSERGLPEPPPPGSANDELQQAAKDAARLFGPDAGDAIDSGPAQPAEPQIEFQTEGAAPSTATPTIGAVTAPPAEQPGAVASLAAGSAEIAALKETFDRELALRDARANAEIASLRAEVERLQQGNPHASDVRDPAAFLALASLQRAIDRGDPFTEEFDAFARLAPGTPAVERLRPIAATGAPTFAALKEDFDPAARAAIAAAARENATGWLGGVAARVQQMVTVRPAVPTAGSGAPEIISRAEGALKAGDLSNAIAEAATLRGAAAAEFAPWLARARTKLAANEAVAALDASFMTAYQN